jgi:HK97 family phage prohead protease
MTPDNGAAMTVENASIHATEFKAISGQINVDEAQGIVECFVSGVGNKDSVGDIVLPGAFTESLKRRKPRVVWGHDWNHPIGKVIEIYEVGPTDRRLPAKMKQAGIGGLFARVQFNLKSEKGREAFNNVAFYGEEQEWSIGYKTLDAIYDNQRKANLLREVELYEVSPVLHGANQLTGTISIKADESADEVSSFGKSKWKMFDREFAARIKEDYPEIWAKGGNIKGNAQYAILTKIAEAGGTAKTQDQTNALELREAWVARHAEDFRLPGVIAQIKWLAVGSRGEDYMKNVVREAMAKVDERKKKDAFEALDELDTVAAEEKGFMGVEYRSLKDELAKRFGGPVFMREIRGGKVTFDHMHDGEPMTMRVGFKYVDGEWLFGDPEKVVVRTIYVTAEDGDEEGGNPTMEENVPTQPMGESPVEKDCGCGCGGKGGCGAGRPSDTMARLRNILDTMKSEISEEIEEKAGRVISSGNLEKLQRAMEILQEVIAAGGRAEIEMKLRAPNERLTEIKAFIDPVLDEFNADASVEDGQISIHSIEGDVTAFKSAFSAATKVYAEQTKGANLKSSNKDTSTEVK